jgi:polyisoprenyl-phosphate glycosyltransferase
MTSDLSTATSLLPLEAGQNVSTGPKISAAPPSRATFSVVVPAFNEAEVIKMFHDRLVRVMDQLGSWEVIYVDDGSRDATPAVLRRLRQTDSRVGMPRLSRNFGKEIATSAGLDHAHG